MTSHNKGRPYVDNDNSFLVFLPDFFVIDCITHLDSYVKIEGQSKLLTGKKNCWVFMILVKSFSDVL